MYLRLSFGALFFCKFHYSDRGFITDEGIENVYFEQIKVKSSPNWAFFVWNWCIDGWKMEAKIGIVIVKKKF